MRYREHDEVRAPEDLPEAGVKAGDRGVVIDELHDPSEDPPDAIMVDYPRPGDGAPRALVTYTTDLSRLISVWPMHDD